MKTFIKNTVIFFIFCFTVLLFIIVCTSKIVDNRTFENDETLSNLLVFEKGDTFDLAIMGISHAREFSDYDNHSTVEKNLGKKMLNLGMGHGLCGMNEQVFFLKYAYLQDVHIDTLVFIISPPLIYSDNLNHAAKTFKLEPFRPKFLYEYLKYDADNKAERIFVYLRSKLSPEWLTHYPKLRPKMERKLTHFDSTVVSRGFEAAFKNGIDDSIFNKNSRMVEQLIVLAKEHNTEVVLMITPALFGKWWGHDNTISLCAQLKEKYGISYFDFAETIFNPELYHDHHHLNSEGLDLFTRTYMQEVF